MCIRDRSWHHPDLHRDLADDEKVMGWRDWFGGKRKTKVPDALWAQTLTALSFLANLAVDEQKRLKTLVEDFLGEKEFSTCLLYTSPSPRARTRYRMPSSA